MNSQLSPEGQATAKQTIDDHNDSFGHDHDDIIAVGIGGDEVVFVSSDPLSVTNTATFTPKGRGELGSMEDWRESTEDELRTALRVLVAHTVNDRSKRVF